MRTTGKIVIILSCFLLFACSPVKLPVKNQYQLTQYSVKQYKRPQRKVTVLVALPDGVSDYQTSEMLYMKKPYKLEPFAYNAWTSPPADMLYPLILQSLQHSHYFYAVASSPYAEPADYRLDTQLIKLHQSFMTKPSHIELSVKVALTDTTKSEVIASAIICKRVPAPCDTPYGGVMAANKATRLITAAVTQFVIKNTGNKY